MINNVSLTGRLTREVELRQMANTLAAKWTLAVNRRYKNKDGVTEADFIPCVMYDRSVEGKRAHVLAQHTQKGSLIGVQGRIQTRHYDNQQGQRVYVTEVIVDEFSFLDTKTTHESSTYRSTNSSEPEVNDDDLPF